MCIFNIHILPKSFDRMEKLRNYRQRERIDCLLFIHYFHPAICPIQIQYFIRPNFSNNFPISLFGLTKTIGPCFIWLHFAFDDSPFSIFLSVRNRVARCPRFTLVTVPRFFRHFRRPRSPKSSGDGEMPNPSQNGMELGKFT
jgi:hypothetical protein